MKTLALLALLALPVQAQPSEYALATACGTVALSEPLASNPEGSWLLWLRFAPTPSSDALVSVICPYQPAGPGLCPPGEPGCEGTYEACSGLRLQSEVCVSGTLRGDNTRGGGTLFYAVWLSWPDRREH